MTYNGWYAIKPNPTQLNPSKLNLISINFVIIVDIFS